MNLARVTTSRSRSSRSGETMTLAIPVLSVQRERCGRVRIPRGDERFLLAPTKGIRGIWAVCCNCGGAGYGSSLGNEANPYDPGAGRGGNLLCRGDWAEQLAYSRHVLASEQLVQANQEIEHLTQVAERERIARDLHDLLGHTLTVIVLKSDVANRLFTAQPDLAHREIAEVEATARKALAEVREAVAGYRAEGLAAEILHARRAFASAGVQLTTDIEYFFLSSAHTNMLCLILREAVTNVIRHAVRRSAISRCTAMEISSL